MVIIFQVSQHLTRLPASRSSFLSAFERPTEAVKFTEEGEDSESGEVGGVFFFWKKVKKRRERWGRGGQVGLLYVGFWKIPKIPSRKELLFDSLARFRCKAWDTVGGVGVELAKLKHFWCSHSVRMHGLGLVEYLYGLAEVSHMLRRIWTVDWGQIVRRQVQKAKMRTDQIVHFGRKTADFGLGLLQVFWVTGKVWLMCILLPSLVHRLQREQSMSACHLQNQQLLAVTEPFEDRKGSQLLIEQQMPFEAFAPAWWWENTCCGQMSMLHLVTRAGQEESILSWKMCCLMYDHPLPMSWCPTEITTDAVLFYADVAASDQSSK